MCYDKVSARLQGRVAALCYDKVKDASWCDFAALLAMRKSPGNEMPCSSTGVLDYMVKQ